MKKSAKLTGAIVVVLFALVVTRIDGMAEQSSSQDNGFPMSVDEAKVTAAKIVADSNVKGKMPNSYRAASAARLLPFLNSSDADIRAVANEAFSHVHLIPLNMCIAYLGADRPISERMPLLILCTKQLGGHEETYEVESGEQVKELLKAELASDVCPPMFRQLTLVLSSQHNMLGTSQGRFGMHINEVITSDRAILSGKRFLSALAEVHKTEGKSSAERVFNMVTALGEEHAGPAIEQWYQIEADPDARRVVVAEKLNDYQKLRWTELPEWKERRKAILKLAANDWDEEIAAKAKELLAEME